VLSAVYLLCAELTAAATAAAFNYCLTDQFFWRLLCFGPGRASAPKLQPCASKIPTLVGTIKPVNTGVNDV